MGRVRTTILIFLFLFFLISGCASIREGIIDITESNIKNEATTIEASENLLKTWDCNYGFVKGALGPYFGEISQVNVEAMEKLEELSKKYGYWDEKHYDMCFSLGTEFLILGETTKNVLKRFAPDVIRLFPEITKMIPAL